MARLARFSLLVLVFVCSMYAHGSDRGSSTPAHTKEQKRKAAKEQMGELMRAASSPPQSAGAFGRQKGNSFDDAGLGILLKARPDGGSSAQ